MWRWRAGARLLVSLALLATGAAGGWATPTARTNARGDSGPATCPTGPPASRPATCPAPWNAALPADEPAVAELCRPRKTTQRLDTAHYVLVHDLPAPAADLLARRPEPLYTTFARFVADTDIPARPPPHKLNVCAFATWAGLRADLRLLDPHAAPSILGYYERGRNALCICDITTCPGVADAQAAVAAAQPQERPRLERRLARRLEWLQLGVWQHEGAHQLLENTGALPSERVPVWLCEGVAMLFEVPLNAEGTLADVNAYRLFEYRQQRTTAAVSAPADGDGAGLPVWLQIGSAHPAVADYPAYWALTAYLRAAYPTQFAALLRQVATGALPPDAAGQRALLDQLFGPLDAAWLRRWDERVRSWPLRGSEFDE
jgi:hypothetical protein